MKVLAVDFGTRRLGVALGHDKLISWARTLTVKSESEALSILNQLVRDESINVLVFGLPLRLNGSEKDEAVKVRNFAATISKTTGCPAVFIDERLTSEEAKTLLIDQGISEREVQHHIDATVAKLLLEQYYREQKQ